MTQTLSNNAIIGWVLIALEVRVRSVEVMTMTDSVKEYLNAVIPVGETITINIEIRDSEKAKELMATMYDRNIEKLGIAVKSWGFWDIQTANKLRLEAIEHEIDRHNQEIQRLMNMSDRDFLEQDTKL